MRNIKYFIHGTIFAIGCPIILYGHVISGALFAPSDIMHSIIFSFLLYIIFSFVGYLLTRQASATGLIASLLIIGFLYLWPIFITILMVVAVCILILFIAHKKAKLDEIHFIVNVISIVIVGFYLFQFVGFSVEHPSSNYRTMTQKLVNSVIVPMHPETTPDIYYIILDGYGRADMLQTLYGYDNSEFIDSLERRGFVVASQSHSNYMRTLLSLSSSLNMQYLNTVTNTMGNSSLWWPLIDAIQHSGVRTMLEKNSYRTVFFTSGWDWTSIDDGDVYKKPYAVMINNFDEGFILQTNLRYFDIFERLGFASFPSFNSQRKIILNAFNQMPEVANIPGPKFIFAHIVAPHPPFVFDSTGSPINPAYRFSWDDHHEKIDDAIFIYNYLGQLSFVNQKTLEMIDGILKNSKTPPIIIIQGDHGPNALYDYSSINDPCFYERTSILNAYYLPGKDPTIVPDDISPVNSFRLVFNQYFNTNFEYLPDRQYASTDDQQYHLVDVTDLAGSSCKVP